MKKVKACGYCYFKDSGHDAYIDLITGTYSEPKPIVIEIQTETGKPVRLTEEQTMSFYKALDIHYKARGIKVESENKSCQFCRAWPKNNGPYLYDDADGVAYIIDKELHIDYDTGDEVRNPGVGQYTSPTSESIQIPIKYCPNCGRAL